MKRTINNQQIFDLDGVLCQVIYIKIGVDTLEKYANIKDKSDGREFHSDDIYVIDKFTKGFKNKIGDYLDPEEFEAKFTADSGNEFAPEFFKQYDVANDRITRRDRKVRINNCGLNYYPVLIPLEEWAPGYEEYWDGKYSTPDFL